MRSLLFGVAWLVAVLSVTPRAAADSALVESYVAPEVCPDVSHFEAELRQRSAASAVPQGSLRVRIEAQHDGFFGQIQRVEHAADRGTRELRHASCEQLVQALALIGALLLSPESQAEAAKPSPAPLPPPVPRTERRAAERGRAAPSVAHGPSLGAAGQALVARGVRFGPRLAYRLQLLHPRSESELRLAWTRIESGTIIVADVGRAQLTYNAAQLRFCEAFVLPARLRLAPCGMLDVGELRGSGTVATGERVTRASLWLSVGLAGKLEWRWSPLSVELSLGALFPLTQPNFYFTRLSPEPSAEEIFKTPRSLGFSGDLMVGLHFL